MLELKKITKDYIVADSKVQALKGVDISFRKSEFVSVLGPSGCGKTTLLNIIGGLDHYTSGEMFIDDISTKNYGDRDWDTYRNHRIGFIFQSYNLIPHQTISQNVELALTISGVDKAERVRRAHEALDKVGLQGQYNKKPNQLSGGQCQRVAIARALVNDPEILLADEPTGALDTVTSVQIMDLIQEIAKECLVIMVTHNPDLAEKYSTRIIKLLDGEVISDSNPFTAGETESVEPIAEPENASVEQATEPDNAESGELTAQSETAYKEPEKRKKPDKKAKLSLWTAFKLSARNLLSKLKRTILVCFAGSIGIIGVATVLAVSSGVQLYIADMQNDMLSGNPVQISTEAMDVNALMSGMSGMDGAQAVKDSVEDGKINVEKLIEALAARGNGVNEAIIRNDITNEYLEYVRSMPKEYYSAIAAYYGINSSNNIYTDYELESIGKRTMSLSAAVELYTSMLGHTDFADYAPYVPMFTEHFEQVPDDPDFILSQYDIISDAQTSKIATQADELMIVVSRDSSLTDLTLAQFGYFTQDEFLNIAYKAVNDEHYDEALWKSKFDIDELVGKTFTWYPNDTVFNDPKGVVTAYNTFTYNPVVGEGWQGKTLKITAVLRPKASVSYGCLQTGFYYTSAFAADVIKDGMASKIVKHLDTTGEGSFNSIDNGNGVKTGISYDYDYVLQGESYSDKGLVGSKTMLSIMMNTAMGGSLGPEIYTLTKRELGGLDTPSKIEIYPTDFDWKDDVCAYLDKWNGDGDVTVGDKTLSADAREDIKYSDNLAIVISLVNEMIDMVTAALVAFTALSLVVSTVMIAIITYVSVMERVKEIGVIRSLGGRKRDVSALFIAETFIIGAASGIFGIAFTYLISLILNQIVGNLFGIFTIASLPITSALIMIAISVALTVVAGIIPASLAAKKDPVEALRTE